MGGGQIFVVCENNEPPNYPTHSNNLSQFQYNILAEGRVQGWVGWFGTRGEGGEETNKNCMGDKPSLLETNFFSFKILPYCPKLSLIPDTQSLVLQLDETH